MKLQPFACLVVVATLSLPALAADKSVKVGLLTTLSGGGAGIGTEIRDGFRLAIKLLDGKLGGMPVEVIEVDDQQNPEVARQATDKLLANDKVDFITGIVFSNILLAVGPTIFNAKTFYISPNAGPSQYAGEQCNPYFFNVAWQNDNIHEVIGRYMSAKGYSNVALIAPDYAAGRDGLNGFKRFYKGKIALEIYTKLDQQDYAAEISQIAASRPDALYFFMPGGWGVRFIKQYAASGLSTASEMTKAIPMFAPGTGADEDLIKIVGSAMIGIQNSSHWAADFFNPQNAKFVTAFRKNFSRTPSMFAAQAYDAALLMDGAIRQVKGNLADKAALRKALEAANFRSVRGIFKFNTNHYPIQDFYLRRVTRAPAGGGVVNVLQGLVMKNHADAYVRACKMQDSH